MWYYLMLRPIDAHIYRACRGLLQRGKTIFINLLFKHIDHPLNRQCLHVWKDWQSTILKMKDRLRGIHHFFSVGTNSITKLWRMWGTRLKSMGLVDWYDSQWHGIILSSNQWHESFNSNLAEPGELGKHGPLFVKKQVLRTIVMDMNRIGSTFLKW